MFILRLCHVHVRLAPSDCAGDPTRSRRPSSRGISSECLEVEQEESKEPFLDVVLGD
jgi:hypothetical protein